MDNFETYYLIKFKNKSGEAVKCLEGISKAMLEMWAMQNTTATTSCLVFNKKSGDVVFRTVGSKEDISFDDKNLGHINDYCEGLLEAVQ